MLESLRLYFKYIGRIRDYSFPLLVGILSDIFSTFLTMIPPLFAILIFDYAFPQKNLSLLIGATLAGLAVYFINFFFSSINNHINVHIDQKISTSMAGDLFQKILHLPISVESKKDIGDLTVRTLEDSDLASGMILNTPQVLTINFVTLLFFLVVSLKINPYVTLLSLASIPIYIFETHFFSGRVKRVQQDVQENRSATLGGLNERLINIRTVKAFGREVQEGEKFRNLLFRRCHLGLKQNVISLFASFSNSITLQLWTTFVSAYMGYETIQGRLSIGQMIALGSYLPQLAGPVQSLAGLYESLRVGMVSLKRVDEVLRLPSEIQGANGENVAFERGHVRLKELFFSYDLQSPILKDISFEIKPHSSVAIVGASGAGKSTLLNLLIRFYDPTQGMILVDGREVQQISLRALRAQIGVVFQEISLFAGTVRENILYGRPNCSEQELYEAAVMAAAHEFILKLPGGYDFRIDQFGQNLSGGQRQRLAIARALVMNPKILILDEAASALDAESEFLLQETIRLCRERMTVMLIAHRFSSIKGVDQIIVLDEGRVAEVGTFPELLAKKGIFFNLYQLQIGGFQEFLQRLEVEFARHERYKEDISLLIFRINNDFLAQSDNGGTIARLMEELNLFIRKNMRIMDFSCVFRENHLLLAMPETPDAAARLLGLRLQNRIASHPFGADGKLFHPITSLAVVSCKENHPKYAEELIEFAQEELLKTNAQHGAMKL